MAIHNDKLYRLKFLKLSIDIDEENEDYEGYGDTTFYYHKTQALLYFRGTQYQVDNIYDIFTPGSHFSIDNDTLSFSNLGDFYDDHEFIHKQRPSGEEWTGRLYKYMLLSINTASPFTEPPQYEENSSEENSEENTEETTED